MTLDNWLHKGKRLTYRSHDIVYHNEGAGETLVCIHGFPTASWDWHKLWPVLTSRFRVIAADMIGFGFSDKPRGYDYSLFDQATLHEALLEHLGFDSVHLLAHDYGDTVVQELLARHLDRQKEGATGLHIKSVCLLNGGIFPEATRPRPIQKLLQSPLGWLVGLLLTERQFRKSFRAVFAPDTQPSDAELEDFWRLIAFNDGVNIAHKISRYQRERRQNRSRWAGALQHTIVPLRLINGLLDPVSGASIASRYRELIAHPDVVMLDGIGHYPQIEAPEAVLKAYLAFVENVVSGSSPS
ncbi:MAG: alpha/beta fold hydrolase [Gemmatimonadales bacterium]